MGALVCRASDDRRRARLKLIHHVLRQTPHKAPKRQKRGDDAEPEDPYKVIADIAGDAVVEKDCSDPCRRKGCAPQTGSPPSPLQPVRLGTR